MEVLNGGGTQAGRAIRFLFENSMFLIGGAIAALLYANVDEHGYHEIVHWALPNAPELHLHFLVNDVLMAVFFAIAGKEVWEALLPGGDLSSPRKAATPLFATVGGVVMPAILYIGGTVLLGQWEELGRGWAIPCATDIAFSYMFARFVFGTGHPAISFLLLLAVADDAIGLVILAVFYPQAPLQLSWLLLALGAVGLAWAMYRVIGFRSFWWYLVVPGVLSWISFYKAGIHAALGLVPIIPFMPHAHTDLGFFAPAEAKRHDALNEFEHWWKHPVELILGLFGFVNAGVVFSNMGAESVLVVFGLIVGKPLGILLFTYMGVALGLKLPLGMKVQHVLTLGIIAGIGFTVALFVTVSAFPEPGPVQDALKMGALASLVFGFIAFPVARALGIKREDNGQQENVTEQPEYLVVATESH